MLLKKSSEKPKRAVEGTPFIDIQSFKGYKAGETLKVSFPGDPFRLCTINTYSDYFTIDWEIGRIPQRVHIEYTSVGYGKRAWFRCPSCSRRRAKLYCVDFVFSCRECHGLLYTTSKISGNELVELDWKILRLQERLGMNVTAPRFILEYVGSRGNPSARLKYVRFNPDYVSPHDEPEVKPKYMKQATFDRLRLELAMLQLERDKVWARKANAALNTGRW